MNQDVLYVTITGHQIKSIVENEIKEFSSIIKGLDHENSTHEKYTPLIDEHKEFLFYLERNNLDTAYTVRKYGKWPNNADKSEAAHLRLEESIIDPLLKNYERSKCVKLKPDFPLLESQLKIIEWFEKRNLNDHADMIKKNFTNKFPVPVMYSDKLCSLSAWGNHHCIHSTYRQANGQAIYHDNWMKNARPEDIKTLNSIKTERIEKIENELNKYIGFIKEHQKDFVDLKELKPKLKELTHAIKAASITNSSER